MKNIKTSFPSVRQKKKQCKSILDIYTRNTENRILHGEIPCEKNAVERENMMKQLHIINSILNCKCFRVSFVAIFLNCIKSKYMLTQNPHFVTLEFYTQLCIAHII